MTDVPMKQAPLLAGWLIALGVGIVTTGVAMVVFNFSFSQASFTGAILFVIVGVILGFARGETVSANAVPVVKPVAPVVAQPAAAPIAAPAVAPAAKAAAVPAPVAIAGKRPAALTAPRGGKADDLKQIKGVGPKMEETCNSLGFYHFDQIANWTQEELAWVDENLEGFKGRATRDEWVAQAKLLAAGGQTEFSKKVEKGGVY